MIVDKEIDRHIGAIVEAAREQATALQEINTAVNTFDQGTQENAAMVEESTAASHTLVQEVSRIAGIFREFNIGKASASRVRPQSFRHEGCAPPSPAHDLRANLKKVYPRQGSVAVQEDCEEF